MTLDKPISSITKADLDSLIRNQTVEGTVLEYKKVLSLEKPEEEEGVFA